MSINFDGPRSRPQLRDEAASHIREMIIAGQAAPSQLIRLGPLAEQLGMSLTPMREALLLLAQTGWVTQEANKGFRVAPFGRRDVEDSYLVNALLSGELAARGATRMDEGTIERLRELDAMIQSAVDTDTGPVAQWNSDIHVLVYTAADSPRLSSFVESASSFVPRHFWGAIPGWMDHNRTGHTVIIDALHAGDAELSRELMGRHIIAARDLLLDYLTSTGVLPSASA